MTVVHREWYKFHPDEMDKGGEDNVKVKTKWTWKHVRGVIEDVIQLCDMLNWKDSDDEEATSETPSMKLGKYIKQVQEELVDLTLSS